MEDLHERVNEFWRRGNIKIRVLVAVPQQSHVSIEFDQLELPGVQVSPNSSPLKRLDKKDSTCDDLPNGNKTY